MIEKWNILDSLLMSIFYGMCNPFSLVLCGFSYWGIFIDKKHRIPHLVIGISLTIVITYIVYILATRGLPVL